MTNLVEYILRLRGEQFQSGIAAAQSSTERLNTSMNALGAAIGVTFGIAGVVMFTKSVVEAGSKVEDARTGLTTLLKDGAEAQKVIEQTMRDATATPFDFESLLMANKALISAGMNSKAAREDVLNLSNAIAATGGGSDELQRMVVNLQQIRNVGKASALDIKQFAFAGVNLYAALDAAGIKYAKGAELTYDQISLALRKAHEEGGIYYNGLENMANNTSIKISNLGDAFFQFRVQLYDKIKPAIISVVDALTSVVKGLTNFTNWIADNKDMLGELALVIGGTTIALNAANIAVGAYAALVGTVTFLTDGWALAQTALNAAMAANPLGLVIVAIGAVVSAIVIAYHKSLEFRGAINGLWAALKSMGESTLNFFKGIGQAIAGVLTFNPAMIAKGVDNISTSLTQSGTRAALAFKAGYDETMAADKEETAALIAEQSKKDKLSKALKTAGKAGAAGAKPATTDKLERATGQKAVTINISIQDLIHDFSIQTTNITESAQKVKEMVTNALLDAINNSQMIPIR